MSLELQRPLGTPGGQGAVFLAKSADGSDVAAKVFLGRCQQSLQTEHDMLTAVAGHQHIIQCLGLEPAVQLPNPRPPNADPYMNPCLKLAIAVGDLWDRALLPNEAPPLAIAIVQRYAEHMVAGVQYIHSLGIAHLDIKPDNMLIDGNDTLKISDFGLAMRMPINAIPRGTQHFMAPELTNKVPLELTAPLNGHKVDVWALGVTMLMVVIKSNPFENRGQLTDILRAAQVAQATPGNNGVAVACQSFHPSTGQRFSSQLVPPGLKTLLNGMLSVDPAQRLTIGQVAGAVAAPTTWSPPPPPPPPPAAAAAFRSLSAADDEAEEPRYNACGASAAYRSAPADDEDFLPLPPPPMRANAGTLMLG